MLKCPSFQLHQSSKTSALILQLGPVCPRLLGLLWWLHAIEAVPCPPQEESTLLKFANHLCQIYGHVKASDLVTPAACLLLPVETPLVLQLSLELLSLLLPCDLLHLSVSKHCTRALWFISLYSYNQNSTVYNSGWSWHLTPTLVFASKPISSPMLLALWVGTFLPYDTHIYRYLGNSQTSSDTALETHLDAHQSLLISSLPQALRHILCESQWFSFMFFCPNYFILHPFLCTTIL